MACVWAAIAWAAPPPAVSQTSDRYFTTTDGVRLHYVEAGDPAAPTLIFVPGWTMPAWIFGEQVASLSPRYHVVAFDPRGQGDSQVPPQGYDHLRRGRDIAELIAALSSGAAAEAPSIDDLLASGSNPAIGERPVVLIGWSLGVLDSLAYAAQFGDSRIAALVLVDNSVGEEPVPEAPPPAAAAVNHGPRPRPHYGCTRRFVAGMFVTPQDPDYIDRLTAACERTPEPAARALLSYPVPRTYWRDALYAVRRPILYIVRPRLAGQAYNLAHNHGDAESVEFSTAGHALFVDEPQRFDALVTDFLARKLGPGAIAP
jgi:microsomal epoxide hydrolase